MRNLLKFNLKNLILLVVIAVTWVNLNQERWLKKDVIAHDIINYNSYLPALFYEGDLSLSFLSDSKNLELEGKLYMPNRTPDGRPVIKMSMGMAVTYLPFFGLAHLYCVIFNYQPNGFSEPYHFAYLFSSLFYFVIGLIVLYKVLIRYFSDRFVCLVLFFLSFGTNVFYYLTNAAALAHTIGFVFVAIFLHLTLQWHQQQKKRLAVLLGLTVGFLALVRPTNSLVVLFFLMYGVTGKESLTNKLKLLLSNKGQLFLMIVSGFIVWIPQLLYWKHVTGDFFFNSYVGEHFYFNNPHIFKALFGFRKGWLIYTPIMICAVSGLFLLRKQLRDFRLALPVFLLVFIYVMFSWWCWWYGGTFGQRVMIDVYPLLAIPFCAFLLYVSRKKPVWRTITYVILGFFVFLNLFQSIQAKYNILHYDSMTFKNYKEIFFTITTKPDREKYLDHPDYDKALRGEDED